jgi:hypothetical protein
MSALHVLRKVCWWEKNRVLTSCLPLPCRPKDDLITCPTTFEDVNKKCAPCVAISPMMPNKVTNDEMLCLSITIWIWFSNEWWNHLLVPIRPKVSNALSISSVLWFSSVFNILSMARSRLVTPNTGKSWLRHVSNHQWFPDNVWMDKMSAN